MFESFVIAALLLLIACALKLLVGLAETREMLIEIKLAKEAPLRLLTDIVHTQREQGTRQGEIDHKCTTIIRHVEQSQKEAQKEAKRSQERFEERTTYTQQKIEYLIKLRHASAGVGPWQDEDYEELF